MQETSTAPEAKDLPTQVADLVILVDKLNKHIIFLYEKMNFPKEDFADIAEQ